MNRTELATIMNERIIVHTKSFLAGYTKGIHTVERQDDAFTRLDFHTYSVALQGSLLDAFEALGLIEE